jgi:hypothetical protein
MRGAKLSRWFRGPNGYTNGLPLPSFFEQAGQTKQRKKHKKRKEKVRKVATDFPNRLVPKKKSINHYTVNILV